MAEESRYISVIEPVSVALERVKEVLFRPFDFPRWLAIGFCAWLAYLGEGGMTNFNYRANDNNRNFSQINSGVMDFVKENWPLVIAIGAVVFILIMAVSIVFTWLRSRGQFMFLHCIANNEARIELPWSQYSKEGNRLFVFRLIAGIISFFVIAFFAVVIIFSVLVLTKGGLAAAAVICLIPAALLLICAAIVMAIFFKFTTDFVVPIMYLRRCGPAEGWRIFLGLLSSNKGEFFLYILFQIVLGIIIFIICYGLPCCLCCFGGCCVMFLLSLPYVWAVVLLPVLAFSRSYSLYYLRQFGPEFDVFTPKVVVPLPQV